MQDATTPIMKDYLKRLVAVSVACSIALVLVVLGGKILAPLLGVGAVTMLCMLILGASILSAGHRAGLFHFKMDEFMTYMATPMRDESEISKRSAATAAAVPGSIVSALLITFMVETRVGLPMVLVPPMYIALTLILITIASAKGRIAASAKESILTLLMIVVLFGYAYETGAEDPCGEMEATGHSIYCEPEN